MATRCYWWNKGSIDNIGIFNVDYTVSVSVLHAQGKYASHIKQIAPTVSPEQMEKIGIKGREDIVLNSKAEM